MCVDLFLSHGEMELKKSLEKNEVVCAWELGPYDPDPSIGIVIVTE